MSPARYALGLVVFIFCAGTITSLFPDRLKKIKDKAKQLYKSKFGKDKSWHFLGGDLTEYPGTNEKYRKINQAKWEEYYDCLVKREQSLGEHGLSVPEALLGFAGNHIKFECNVCLSPRERRNEEAIDWYWGHINDDHLKPVVYDESVFISPESKALQIYNLQEDHSGQYLCKMGDAPTVPYYLTVTNRIQPLADRAIHLNHKDLCALAGTSNGLYIGRTI